MKKVFISQPMVDKTDEQIKEERKKAIEVCKERLGEDVEIIDSFFEGAPHDASPLWFLGKSIQLLSTADIAYFIKGAAKYRGCNAEYLLAVTYGKTTITEDHPSEFTYLFPKETESEPNANISGDDCNLCRKG